MKRDIYYPTLHNAQGAANEQISPAVLGVLTWNTHGDSSRTAQRIGTFMRNLRTEKACEAQTS